MVSRILEDKICGLGLGLERFGLGLGLGLDRSGLGLGLGLEDYGLGLGLEASPWPWPCPRGLALLLN